LSAPSFDAAAAVRSAGGTVGYAPGAFDLFHVGHLNLLRRARLNCDFLVAGVVCDEATTRRKGRRPLTPEGERLAIVASMRFVDLAVMERTDNRLDVWNAVPFDVVFKGSDWQGTDKGGRLEREFAQVGVTVVYLPYTHHISTSTLRSAVRSD
jgi:glycerol-3-phosphate cytidylyltransferase